MKKLVSIALIGASALALTTGAASAQSWRADDHGRYDAPMRGDRWVSISDRAAQLDQRIDRGVETRSLDRREAWRLRSQLRDLTRLEGRYRSNGLSMGERADLDRRFDRLAMQIRADKRDNQYGYGYRH
jgi:hypothetical protein